MKKRILWISAVILVVLLTAGCSTIDNPDYITAESTGFWSKYIVYPLSWVITTFAEMFGNSYGLAIIVVTILIRLAILPLMIKQTQNSKAMQAIQPEMQKLKEKYSSKDQKTQQKLQEETMKLFQTHNVNPLAGCFPLLIQMPILIGFYQAIIRTEGIAKAGDFLWFDLGAPDPLYLLPIIAGITTFLQQKIMMAGTGNANPQMQMMLYIMPVMILIFAINFPAALALYWVVGNIFMIVQTYFIKPPVAQTNNQNNTNKGKVRGAKK
ncbi:YidC family membrane integrase SpoIIIJ [Lederbergia galactosidilytica]|uniref:Membrane protein insertase YidC n=1 Tax=Lederbergia galactosidilytica TaxID=217031 RepID=A0A178A5H1_9BACI|nr:YidC family membrane integrase SpoIIIJ [Lederbergia galactosidilytica]KRG07994.1 OxaA-like protein precursor [Virgibacillus soli]MBP1915225.1 YidC/Oxa1 family membrane protein insertase [Lederbergia galactosidilytica]OAK75437.1 OxaA-like protein precursor [Lederbergia galactosidilytica]